MTEEYRVSTDAEENGWWVTCARCGIEIRGERTRLFWSTDPENPGTYRTCKNEAACQRRLEERARREEVVA